MLTKLRSKGKNKVLAKATQREQSELKPPSLSSASMPSTPAKALSNNSGGFDGEGLVQTVRQGRQSVPVGAASPQLRTKEDVVSQLRDMLVNGYSMGSTNNSSSRSGVGHVLVERSLSQPSDCQSDVKTNGSDSNSAIAIGSICSRRRLPPIHLDHSAASGASVAADQDSGGSGSGGGGGGGGGDGGSCMYHHHYAQQPMPHPCPSTTPPSIDLRTRFRSAAYRRSFSHGSNRSSFQYPCVVSSRSGDRSSFDQAFLIFSGETKRCRLPNHQLASMDAVRTLFIQAFPAKLTASSFTESTDLAVYILDPYVNVFYELEDVREVCDMSVLKIVSNKAAAVVVPMPITVQSPRVRQVPEVTIKMQSPQPPQLPKSPSPMHRHAFYEDQWHCSAPYVGSVPASPRFFEGGFSCPSDSSSWSSHEPHHKWSSQHFCCPSSSLDEKRLTTSDAGRSYPRRQMPEGYLSHHHNHYLHHSVAYLPGSVCYDTLEQTQSNSTPPDNMATASVCPSVAVTATVVEVPTCVWPTSPTRHGRVSPIAGSDAATELEYDTRKRMQDVENRLASLTRWLQNNIVPVVTSHQTSQSRDVAKESPYPDIGNNASTQGGDAVVVKERCLEPELGRTMIRIKRQIFDLRQEWQTLRVQNLERTRDVQEAIDSILLNISNGRRNSFAGHEISHTSTEQNNNSCTIKSKEKLSSFSQHADPSSDRIETGSDHDHPKPQPTENVECVLVETDPMYPPHEQHSPLSMMPPLYAPRTPESPIWQRAERSSRTPSKDSSRSSPANGRTTPRSNREHEHLSGSRDPSGSVIISAQNGDGHSVQNDHQRSNRSRNTSPAGKTGNWVYENLRYLPDQTPNGSPRYVAMDSLYHHHHHTPTSPGRPAPPPPPPPRRMSQSMVKETTVFLQPKSLESSTQTVVSRRVSVPGGSSVRRQHSSSPARANRVSSFAGESATIRSYINQDHSTGTVKLESFRSPVLLPKYTQDLATGIYSALNRPDLQDQWLNVADVMTMQKALAMQRELQANEASARMRITGFIASSSSPAVNGTRSNTCTRSSSSDDDDDDDDDSSASGDSQATILRGPGSVQETKKKESDALVPTA